MNDYAHKQNICNHERAISIFTDGLKSRQMMFEHVVLLLCKKLNYKQK